MSFDTSKLPQVGDAAPFFMVPTETGHISFPEYRDGCWCIFFAHPANFTSAWWMYSTFLALKERWFNARNTKMLTLSNEPVRQNGWSDKVRRYIGIYLKSPVIQDLDFEIAGIYGMASGRRPMNGFDRLAFIIDPEGIIRLIIKNPLPSIEGAILELEKELDRLQGNVQEVEEVVPVGKEEVPDVFDESFELKPAYFPKHKLNLN
ncbi:MAG: redoxin domain-containing protein [Saprospiraceae bacterium]|jgi:peroxiredoxin (alkyl hydroperoxide reductase subunit C)